MRKLTALPLAMLIAGGLTAAACSDDDDSIFTKDAESATDGTSADDEPTDVGDDDADTSDTSDTSDTEESDTSDSDETDTSDSVDNPLDDLPTGVPDSGQIADMLEDVYADMGFDFSREQVECLVDEMGLDQISPQSDQGEVMDEMMGNIFEIMETCEIDIMDAMGN